jgi:hypothetical protein
VALDISATIHPGDGRFVLVSVQDGNGQPVADLTEANFEVNCWASGAFIPGGSLSNWLSLPVAKAELHPVFGSSRGAFYQLELGDIRFGDGDEGSPGLAPQALDPAVYGVVVNSTQGDRGQAIACRCNPGDVKPKR